MRANAGVWLRKNGRFMAVVYRGEQTFFAGTWSTRRAAAIARDRAVLYLGFDDQTLNFPTQSRRLGAASPEALQRECHFARKIESKSATEYRGVRLYPGPAPLWKASLKLRGRNAVFLGNWPTARDAAVAHDRAALYYGLSPRVLNFPDRRHAPADAEALCAEARLAFKAKTSSRFRGVCFYRARGNWIAYVNHGGRRHNLGYFRDEEDAARARDKRVLKLLGRNAKLNFDPKTDEELLGRRPGGPDSPNARRVDRRRNTG